MPLPKMHPQFGRRVQLWRRRAKVVDENGEHHKPTRSDDNNKRAQTFDPIVNDKEKEQGNLGVRRADQPLVCPSSPSFKFYIFPSVRENKNDGKSSCTRETNTKAAGNLEPQTSIDLVPSQESKRKMKGEAKRVRKWRMIPGKAMKNLIHRKPCCRNLCYHGD
ncbi:hypothetical protein V6N12_013596 [Hibiscus sabdariffa]|uniref:Uncharacterized protein n=2 Tax=Hibiscus sabdariffa TaxID=183260 RepID=A0ABR2C9T6_9ROSI